jgi:hypothetical protein
MTSLGVLRVAVCNGRSRGRYSPGAARINFFGADQLGPVGTGVAEVVEFIRAAEDDPRDTRGQDAPQPPERQAPAAAGVYFE